VAGEVAYDIALARIVTNALPLEELTIRGESFKLTGFMPAQFIQQGTWVSATLRNANPRGSIESLHATATIQYGSQLFEVHNLFGVNVAAQKGDSGGLIYQDAQAVGIEVSRRHLDLVDVAQGLEIVYAFGDAHLGIGPAQRRHR